MIRTYVILAIIVAFSLSMRVRMLDMPLDRDEGEYAYTASIMLDGGKPYRDVYTMRLPGIFLTYMAILAIFGKSPTGVHAGLALVNSLSTLFVFFLALKLFGKVPALFSSAVFSLISLSPAMQGMSANTEHFVIFYAMGSILLLLRAREGKRFSYYLSSGLLMGVAILTKQNGAFFALFSLSYLLFMALTSGQDKKAILTWPAMYFLGLTLPYIAASVTILFSGSYEKYIFWTYTYPMQYISSLTLSMGLFNLKFRAVSAFEGSYAFVVLAALGASGVYWHRQSRIKIAFTIASFVFSFLAVSPGLYFRNHYFIFLIPSIALLCGAFAHVLETTLRKSSSIKPEAAIALIAVIACAIFIYSQKAPLFFMDNKQYSRVVFGANPFPEMRRVGEYIRENTSPEDSIAVLGSEAELMFYADRRSATGYISTYEMLRGHGYAEEMKKEFVSEIERAEPAYIIVVLIRPSGPITADAFLLKWANSYVPKHYVRDGLVEISPDGGESRFLFGKDAAKTGPSMESYIQLYKRI